MTALRVGLVAVGVAVLVFGATQLAAILSLADLAWLVVWLAAALVIHDAVLVPALVLVRSAFRRRSRAWPRVIGVVAEVAFATVAILTLYVAPELWAQARGTPNPTLLTGDYAPRLLWAWALAAIVVIVVARVVLGRQRRQRRLREGAVRPRRTR
ncbi:hypothetical protein K0817_013795 [Microbacterium sp. HD4P20]|uniref:hypothetical protein n=1 Tax=Microbacterium sp. HD4P20 TaxID=2864874 RepID=UPI001C64094C|nr:hypothetical protein [Microbacterium sp. HD4P20]MCP2637627.1 hypothetical protein [Microbacterium sp. HD4P20]